MSGRLLTTLYANCRGPTGSGFGVQGGQSLTSKLARLLGGGRIYAAGVIDSHWLQKAAMDFHRAGLTLIDIGAMTASVTIG